MIDRTKLSVIVFAGALLWLGLLLFQGVAVSPAWLRPLTAVVPALLALLGAFDLWLWRIPFLQGWFVKRPDVSGTWSVKIASTWKDPVTGLPSKPKQAFMVVKQTYSSLFVTMMTEESQSTCLSGTLIREDDGSYRLGVLYRNEPRQAARGRSPIHFGGMLLSVRKEGVTRLDGHYWTDRGTAGEIEATNRQSKRVDSFAAASTLTSTQPAVAAR